MPQTAIPRLQAIDPELKMFTVNTQIWSPSCHLTGKPLTDGEKAFYHREYKFAYKAIKILFTDRAETLERYLFGAFDQWLKYTDDDIRSLFLDAKGDKYYTRESAVTRAIDAIQEQLGEECATWGWLQNFDFECAFYG